MSYIWRHAVWCNNSCEPANYRTRVKYWQTRENTAVMTRGEKSVSCLRIKEKMSQHKPTSKRH